MFAPDATAALEQLRDDKASLHWMVLRAADDGKSFSLTGSGNDGFDSFLSCLAAQEPGLFGGVLRLRAVDNRGSVQSVRAKFLRVTTVSSALPMMKRARAASLKPELEKFFGSIHLNIDTDDLTTLNKLDVARALLRAGGAHTPNSFEFSGGAEATEADIIKIEGGAPMPPQTVSKPPPPPPAPVAAPAPAPAPAPVPEPPKKLSPADAWARVVGDADALNWVLMTYDGKSASTAEVVATGTLGLEELKAALGDDQVLFGGLRVTAIDDRGSVQSVRSKFVFVQHVPNGVKPVVRAHAGTARGDFQKILAGTHVAVNIEAARDLQVKALEEKLHGSCGAHKPNGYDFGTKKRSGDELAAAAPAAPAAATAAPVAAPAAAAAAPAPAAAPAAA
jgi:hypothetical protein